MSVKFLYCEGNQKSIDISILKQLLPECDVRPLGGKTSNFLGSVIADRRRQPNLACLVDRDFDCSEWEKSDLPIRYEYEGVWVGWSWARKEIENYLIDPVVVKRALGNKAPSPDEYQVALDRAAESIAAYSAARTALTCDRFKNFFGEEVRKGYWFPPKLGRDYCQTKIAEIVREYAKGRIVSEDNVLDKFKTLLPHCRPGGSRFDFYLYYFAGKDLLYAMRSALIEFGFEPTNFSKSPEEVFLERVTSRIERLDEVWEWLPEWATLRQCIEETDFSVT